MKRKIIIGFIGIMMFAFTGCGQSDSTNDNTVATSNTDSTPVTATPSNEATNQTDDTATYGQVTGISDQTITVALGTKRQRGEQGQKPDNSNTNGNREKPSMDPENLTSPDPNATFTPSENTTSSSEQDNTAAQKGTNSRPSSLELTGESLDITVTSDTTITISNNGETTTGTIDDIKEGDTLKIILNESNEAESIEVVNFSMGKTNKQTTTTE